MIDKGQCRKGEKGLGGMVEDMWNGCKEALIIYKLYIKAVIDGDWVCGEMEGTANREHSQEMHGQQ